MKRYLWLLIICLFGCGTPITTPLGIEVGVDVSGVDISEMDMSFVDIVYTITVESMLKVASVPATNKDELMSMAGGLSIFITDRPIDCWNNINILACYSLENNQIDLSYTTNKHDLAVYLSHELIHYLANKLGDKRSETHLAPYYMRLCTSDNYLMGECPAVEAFVRVSIREIYPPD